MAYEAGRNDDVVPFRRRETGRRSDWRRRMRVEHIMLGVLLGAGLSVFLTIETDIRDASQRPGVHRPSGAASAGDRGDVDGVVTRIVDGDTFYMTGAGTRIRLWGLDAPEVSDPGGAAATHMLTEIAYGEHVTCERMDIDKYGRIVGRCRLTNGCDISALMIKSGTAAEYTYFSKGYYARRRSVCGRTATEAS